MPYLIGLLGFIVTVLVLLRRLADAGIDLGGLNPFLWKRRRVWRQKFEGNPLFSLEDPKDVAAVLAVGTAKADGDMSAEQKQALLSAFERIFSLDAQSSADLLASSAHLIGDGQILRDQVGDVVARSKHKFTESQVDSTLSLLDEIAAVEGITARQRELMTNAKGALSDQDDGSTWS